MNSISFGAMMQINSEKGNVYINPKQVVKVTQDFPSGGSIVETSNGEKHKYDISASKMVKALWEADQIIDIPSINVFKSWEANS